MKGDEEAEPPLWRCFDCTNILDELSCLTADRGKSMAIVWAGLVLDQSSETPAL